MRDADADADADASDDDASVDAIDAPLLPARAREERLDDADAVGADASALSTARAMRAVAALGSPLIVQYVSTSLSSTFALSLLSRASGEAGVAAYSMGNIACSLTAHSVIWGLGAGVDTLSSQANGRGRVRAVGETAARATVILWVCAAAPGGCLFWRAATWLRWFGVDASVADDVQAFARVRIPGLFTQCVTCVALKTMMAMKLSKRVGVLSVSTTPLKFAAPWFFVRRYGLHGAALSLTSVDFGTCAMYLTAFWTSARCRETFRGVSVSSAFRGWFSYLKLAVPGLFMQAIEWWSWDFNTIIAGMCDKATLELASQAFLSNTYFFFYSWACVWSRGASTSVGNALGERNIRDAATLTRSTAMLSFAFALSSAALFYVYADALFATYTSDQNIVSRLDELVPMLSVLIVTDGVQVAVSGVIVGAGYQAVTTPILVFAYWVVGIPLATYLALGRPKMGLYGVWLGIITSSSIHLVWNLLICFAGRLGVPFAIRWNEACEKATARLDADEKLESAATGDSASGSDDEAVENL